MRAKISGRKLALFFVAAIRLFGFLTYFTGGRGFWHLCKGFGHLLPARYAEVKVHFDQDCVINISLKDPYWCRVVCSGYEYEGEVLHLLEKIKSLPFTFVDCGANIGYWSFLVSSRRFGEHSAIAIEASGATFDLLKDNNEENLGRVEILHRAIFSRSKQSLCVEEIADHASRRISSQGTVVESICLDDLLGTRSDGPYVIKLDIEGAEVAALAGAKSVLQKVPCLLLYEDHGNDPQHDITRYIQGEMGYRVFFLEERGWEEIFDADSLTSKKKKKSRGYNLMACAKDSPFASILVGQGKG